MKKLLLPLFALLGVVACSAGESSPTSGVVSMQFPSTQAAVLAGISTR